MLGITEVLQVKVTATVKKTGKTYHRSMNYAKRIIGVHIGISKEKDTHEYFLREGRGWKPVSEKEYAKATSEEAVEKVREQLSQELRERVEKLMRVEKN